MTDREKLLLKTYEIRNQIKELKGEELFDIESFAGSWTFRSDAKKETIASLQQKIENLTRELEVAKKAKALKDRIDAYLSTEEGKQRMATLEEQKALELAVFRNYRDESFARLNRFAKEVIARIALRQFRQVLDRRPPAAQRPGFRLRAERRDPFRAAQHLRQREGALRDVDRLHWMLRHSDHEVR